MRRQHSRVDLCLISEESGSQSFKVDLFTLIFSPTVYFKTDFSGSSLIVLSGSSLPLLVIIELLMTRTYLAHSRLYLATLASDAQNLIQGSVPGC